MQKSLRYEKLITLHKKSGKNLYASFKFICNNIFKHYLWLFRNKTRTNNCCWFCKRTFNLQLVSQIESFSHQGYNPIPPRSWNAETYSFFYLLLYFRVSYIEIYNEQVIDLLSDDQKALKIREENGEVVVKCTEAVIGYDEEVLEIMQKGDKIRRTGRTDMNEHSSRSHTIFRIVSVLHFFHPNLYAHFCHLLSHPDNREQGNQ